MTLMPHPYAKLFPKMNRGEFEELRDDIRDNGVKDAIVMLDGMILDGCNRFDSLIDLAERGEALGAGWGHRAGEALVPEHLEPYNIWFRRFDPDQDDADPLTWVLSKNLKRRHLTDDQRRMVGARLVSMKQGRPPEEEKTSQVANISRSQAADIVHADIPGIDRARAVIAHAVQDVIEAVDAGQLSVSAASVIAKLQDSEQPAALEKVLPSGNRAVMASRQEPSDSLDFFPTPPWATRALIEHVLPKIGAARDICQRSVWEPACGEGHIAEVLAEYFGSVIATDIHDYGYSSRLVDFLQSDDEICADWIVTNPPFGDKTETFVLKALSRARYGVAMFVRLQWLETVGRYERIFRDRPPTQVAFFVERVPLCKGRWNPEGDTATAYIWLVWNKHQRPQPPFWIPPVCRETLTRPNDAEQFTQHPVAQRSFAISAVTTHSRSIDSACYAQPATSCEPLELPACLKRGADNMPPFAMQLSGQDEAIASRMEQIEVPV